MRLAWLYYYYTLSGSDASSLAVPATPHVRPRLAMRSVNIVDVQVVLPIHFFVAWYSCLCAMTSLWSESEECELPTWKTCSRLGAGDAGSFRLLTLAMLHCVLVVRLLL